MKLILIVGKRGSGKNEVCNILKKYDLKIYEMSDYIFKNMKELNIPINNENTIIFSNKIRQMCGKDIVAKWTLKNIKEKIAVISGVRSKYEINYFKKHAHVIVLYINADKKIRFERIIKRNRDTDPKDWRSFEEREFSDNKLLGIDNIKPDYIIENNKSLMDLRKKIGDFILFLNNKGFYKFNKH